MSGGYFDYKQFHINEIAEQLENYIYGRTIEDDEMPYIKADYEKGWYHDEEYDFIVKNKRTLPNEFEFSEDTMNELKKGLNIIKLASIYAHRIDWLLEGDDGEETFKERLKEEINKLNNGTQV